MYQKRNKCMITGIVFLCVLFWGGFFDFAAIAMGAVFTVVLLVLIHGKKKILLPEGMILYSSSLFGVSALVACVLAFDKGAAWIGILRIATVFIFGLMWMNLEDNSRKEVFDALPFSGACINLIGFAAWFIPGMRSYFYSAGRLWGSMQYANTWALFLLIGIVILFCKEKVSYQEWAETVILLVGIIMTGSRSVFILSVVFGGWTFLKSRADKKIKLLSMGLTILIVIAVQLFMGLDIGRLAEISINSSTFNGRVLYWQDAMSLIGRHPMGIGYMNYYFIQPQIQTGYYFTKNVHNDLLQCVMDNGMPAAIAVMVLVGYGLYSKKNSKRNKLVLLVLVLHSLFDFDLEFMVMACIFVMCLPIENKQKEISARLVTGVIGAAGCICFYFAVTLGADYFGNVNLSLEMYPYNTMARKELLSMESDVSYQAAERIIEENGMIADAWEVRLQQAVDDNNYEAALDAESQMLKCAGYDLYYYNQAVLCLSHVLDTALRSGELENGQLILTEIQNIPDKIDQLKKRTSDRAWKLYEKPSFELDENIQNYIQELEGIQLN